MDVGGKLEARVRNREKGEGGKSERRRARVGELAVRVGAISEGVKSKQKGAKR